MNKTRHLSGQAIGAVITLFLIAVFIANPSFPTPDKIIIFLFFFFMIFGQAFFMLKRLLPFVVILLAYDSLRGFADQLNTHVNYNLLPAFDRWLFSDLPTVSLQNWLWKGYVQWYDLALYIPYLLHFVLPLGLAVLIWKTKESYYWQFVTAFSLVSFAAFFTFLLFPAAPPWLASNQHYIEPVQRISSDVWASLGLKDFASVYNRISPNAVAAVPSLHAAWATLIFVYVWKFFGRRWAALAIVYPLAIYFGTIYEGEHYAFDIIAGIVYAIAAYLAAPYVLEIVHKGLNKLGWHLKRFR